MSADRTLAGLVLRRWDLGESDRRLVLLTDSHGRVDVVAKGAKKSGSRLAGVSEPLSVAQFHVSTGKRLAYISQAQPITSFSELRRDYDRLLAGLAFAELLASIVQPDHESRELFHFALQALSHLSDHPKYPVAFAWASLQLMSIEGFLPLWTSCAVTGGPILENPGWVSPTAGGYVQASVANEFADRFLVAAEVLIGLDKLHALDAPPPNLKRVMESLRVLELLWLHHAGRKLDAVEALMRNLSERPLGESPAS